MKRINTVIALVLASSIAFSAVGCSAFGDKTKSKKKDKEENALFDEKAVSKAAKVFGDALVAHDQEDLIALSTSDDIDILFDDFTYPDATELYKTWLSALKMEVDEDSIDIDGDEASVMLTFQYVDPEDLELTDSTIYGWKDAILDATPEGEKDIELKLIYDDDDEMLKVDNGDDASEEFNDMYSSLSFDVEEIDYSSAFSIGVSNGYTTDDITVSVYCGDYEALNDHDITIDVSDPSGDLIATVTLVYQANAELSCTFSSSDYGTDGEFAAGSYTIDASLDDHGLSMYIEIEEAPEDTKPDGTGDIIGGLDDSSLKEAPDEVKGTYDISADSYINEYFELKVELNGKFMGFDAATLQSSGADNMNGLDFGALYIDKPTSASGEPNLAAIMVYESEDLNESYFDLMAASDEVEEVDLNGIKALTGNFSAGVPIYMILKDNYVMIIAITCDDTDIADTFISGIKPI